MIGYFDPDEPVANLIGNLPHWRQKGVTYFVTFRCADALPPEKLDQWNQELVAWLRSHPEPRDLNTRREFCRRFPQRMQEWLDAGYGECLLRMPRNRQQVETALRHFAGQRYSLDSSTVASNHVHVLVSPLGQYELSNILHSWKSYSSKQINRQSGRSGPFWQKESFDHIVRSPASLEKFRKYIRTHDKVEAASSRLK
jgi:REP element-mobilizing transposase RayT